MFIEQPAKWLRWLYPKAIWRMDKNDHSVYLTFDDGPIPESTPFILETLRKYNIKATFFMVGENVLRNHDLYNQIVAEGHQIGNHTFNHIGAFKHRVISYVLNTNKANDIIHAHLFRPPHGWMRPERVLVAAPHLQGNHVGCGDPRLFQMDDGRRCGEQCEEVCPQRQHHHLPRLAEEHRQTEDGTSTIHRMADGTGI